MDQARRQTSAVLAPQQMAYRFGGFELRPGRQLLRHGNPVPIGGTALELLRLLLRARGDLVTKEEFFEAVWPDVVVVENTLHQHMRALRQALGGEADLIGTVSRKGYRFAGTVEEVPIDSWDVLGSREKPPPVAAPLTPLIGREAEVVAIELLLQTHRCVTLLGPGGVGKTRLALEVARRRVGSVYVAELAPVADDENVAVAIATSLGLSGPSGVPPLTRIRHYTGLRRTRARIDSLLGEFRFTTVARHQAYALQRMGRNSSGMPLLATQDASALFSE